MYEDVVFPNYCVVALNGCERIRPLQFQGTFHLGGIIQFPALQNRLYIVLNPDL